MLELQACSFWSSYDQVQTHYRGEVASYGFQIWVPLAAFAAGRATLDPPVKVVAGQAAEGGSVQAVLILGLIHLVCAPLRARHAAWFERCPDHWEV